MREPCHFLTFVEKVFLLTIFTKMVSDTVKTANGCFFKDGKKRADFVLVIDPDKLDELQIFIHNLETVGLEFEGAKGKSIEKTFLLIHISQKATEHFSKMYDIGNEEKKIYDVNTKYVYRGIFETPLSNQPDKEKGEFLSADRIMIIRILLTTTKFGESSEHIGLEKMMKIGLILTAYPLHDGPLKLHDFSSSPTHDRQMLYRHWANLTVWYKEVPLNVVKRYFGCEIAFYFCWLEFFNKMLILPSILGFLIVITNIIVLYVKTIPQINEICHSDNMFLCPTCVSSHTCGFKPLSSLCDFSQWNYVFDNYLSVNFAILMSIWATLFINLWRRKSNALKLKWDVQFEDTETNIRLKHLDSVKRRKFSYITGTYEPYIPLFKIFFRMTITSSICLFMILLDIAAVFGIISFKVALKTFFWTIRFFRPHSTYWAMVVGCIIQVIIIKLFAKMYGKLSIWLTDFENPRTQKEFDNSVLYKRYILSFANNYTSLFYIAFFKGYFYTVPHTESAIPLITKDSCKPLPCVVRLCIQMFFVMIFKRLAGNVLTLLYPQIKKFIWRALRKSEKKPSEEEEEEELLPQYEIEYKLLPTNRYFLTTEFSEMVIQFGFVTFFVAAFPLAPLCSLLNNILEMRLDAFKMIALYRRPLPRKASGIGAWDGVLLGLTYISCATNGMVIAFTSDFVSRRQYFNKFSHLRGFVNHTLSAFATEDNPLYNDITPKKEICFYRGMRYPPWDPHKYEITSDHWVDVTWRLFFVLIFEHIVLVMNTVLSFVLPDVPQMVKDQLNMDRKLAKEAKLALLNKDERRLSDDTSRQRKKDTTQVGPISGYSY
ncbi:unnamed protein product [Phaedon cochleariae]|uniref:Anoctamin n=1 Tax=Phaedon cochleariae TaxID=80249 RepID=A0A9P0DBF6_PHACE|nr:unnamed protein product [Phaedon cochleariae]